MSTATTTPDTRDEWAKRAHERTGLPRTLLRAIRADGALATDPRDGDPSARRRMDAATAGLIAGLIVGSGIGPSGRLYLAALLRGHYGYSLGPPIPPAALTADEAAFIRARAWELIEQARQERRGPIVIREGAYQ